MKNIKYLFLIVEYVTLYITFYLYNFLNDSSKSKFNLLLIIW